MLGRYSETRNQYGRIIFQGFYVWNVRFNLFASGIWQITYPYASICKCESAYHSLRCRLYRIEIGLTQQLF